MSCARQYALCDGEQRPAHILLGEPLVLGQWAVHDRLLEGDTVSVDAVVRVAGV